MWSQVIILILHLMRFLRASLVYVRKRLQELNLKKDLNLFLFYGEHYDCGFLTVQVYNYSTLSSPALFFFLTNPQSSDVYKG